MGFCQLEGLSGILSIRGFVWDIEFYRGLYEKPCN